MHVLALCLSCPKLHAGCVQEKLPWSEEVLVSKAELEERRAHVAELEQQVAELTMQTEYQLRLKDLHVQVSNSSGPPSTAAVTAVSDNLVGADAAGVAAVLADGLRTCAPLQVCWFGDKLCMCLLALLLHVCRSASRS